MFFFNYNMKKHNHNYKLFVKGYSYITSAYCVGFSPKFRFTVLRKEMIRIFLSVSIMEKSFGNSIFSRKLEIFETIFRNVSHNGNGKKSFPYVNRKPVFGWKP